MQRPETYTFTRYLAAKKSVDDRALNHVVWQQLVDRQAARQATRPLEVLEIGAGIGTMVERLVDGGVLTQANYRALDALAENSGAAAQRLTQWGTAQGLQVTSVGVDDLHLRGATLDLRLQLTTADLFALLASPGHTESAAGRYDLLIAHAFLDLVDIPSTLPRLRALLAPGGCAWFTINFDGATILQPTIDPAYDELLETLYHGTMDNRLVAGKPSGDSRSGRHLFGNLAASGFRCLAAGSSDWVVFAGPNGYIDDESYFLHFIIDTMRGALLDHPALPNRAQFLAWIDQRHRQIEGGELVYIAHQLDFLVETTDH